MLSETILAAMILFGPMQGIHNADNIERFRISQDNLLHPADNVEALQEEVLSQGVIIDDLREKLAIAEGYYREEVENTEIVIAGYERKIKQMRRSSRFEKAICWTKIGLAGGIGYVVGDD